MGLEEIEIVGPVDNFVKVDRVESFVKGIITAPTNPNRMMEPPTDFLQNVLQGVGTPEFKFTHYDNSVEVAHEDTEEAVSMDATQVKIADSSEVLMTPAVIPLTPEPVCEHDRQELLKSEDTELSTFGGEMRTIQE